MSSELRCKLQLNGTAGWNFEATFCATFLATHSNVEITARARNIAMAFGAIHSFPSDYERVRRGDLCADFANFSLPKIGARSLVVQRRAKVCKYHEYAETTRMKRYAVNHRVPGWTVCPGAKLMLRIYDKTEEVSLGGREPKKALEEMMWKEAGWTDGQRVTRVEFQFRTEALQQLAVHTLDDFFIGGDRLWSYSTRKWFSIRIPSDE